MNDPVELRNVFFALVDDVCLELGYPPRTNRPDGDEVVAMDMELDSFPFAVVHSLITVPEKVLIECRFGPLPQDDQVGVMQRLLQLNYALADAGEAIFCMEADTGVIIFTRSRPLSGLTGRELLGSMTQMSWQAAQWNKHRFMEGKQQQQSEAGSIPVNFGALA